MRIGNRNVNAGSSKMYINNYWNMLRYMYRELDSRRFSAINIDVCNTIDDLCALVLCTWCAVLAKDGLYKEYIEMPEEELNSPRGQINVTETIIRQSLKRGAIVCNFDELSEDIYLNRVLKGTLQFFLYEPNINNNVKNEIRKVMQLYNGVSYTDIKYIKWKEMKFNNNTIRYRHPIDLCKTYVDEHKLLQSGCYDDDKRLYVLFKKQLLRYIDKKYGEDRTVEIFEMPYTLDSENAFEKKIFNNQRMVAIRNTEQALVYMIRLQDERMYADTKLPRARMEELVRYLREYQNEYKVKASGAIIYVNTDGTKLNLQPLTTNSIDNYLVGETIVDIHDQWRFTENKINDVFNFFMMRQENKRGRR